LSPDGRVAITGGENGSLRVLNLSSGKCVQELSLKANNPDGHVTAVTALAFSGDGQHVASGSVDGQIKYWNLHTGKCEMTMNKSGKQHALGISSVLFQPKTGILTVASHDGVLRMYDQITAKSLASVTDAHGSGVTEDSSVAVLDISFSTIDGGAQAQAQNPQPKFPNPNPNA